MIISDFLFVALIGAAALEVTCSAAISKLHCKASNADFSTQLGMAICSVPAVPNNQLTMSKLHCRA